MKSRVSIDLFVGIAALAALLFPALSAAQQCIPSCDEKDGRFLAITDGFGLDTLTDENLDISVRVRAGELFFLIDFFDGDVDGLWDLAGRSFNPPSDPIPPEQQYFLYADPQGDGLCGGDGCDAADLVRTFIGETMPDNAWCSVGDQCGPEIGAHFVANDLRALNGDGSLYVYLLRAQLIPNLNDPNMPTDAPVRNSFKVRTGQPEEASIEVFQQPFAFNASLPGVAEVEIVYPGCLGGVSVNSSGVIVLSPECFASLSETTYNGEFSFFIEETQAQSEFIIWDGDLDHGSWDGSFKDTDDPTVLPGIAGMPPWACEDPFAPCDDPDNPPLGTSTGNPLPFEGVATSPIPGATGSPPDDFFPSPPFPPAAALFGRSPSLIYEVWSPACPSRQPGCAPIAVNTNPSGNREWELFCIAVTGVTECQGILDGVLAGEDGSKGQPPDVTVSELPAGTYEVRVIGLDMENLNAFRFGGRAVSVPCDECKGGVTQLTLEYNGTLDPEPTIRAEKDSNEVYFEGPVGTGGRFTLENGGERVGDVDIYINDILNTSIHTSCSQPIFPGLVTGDFTVVEGISKDNGLICVDIGCNECDGGVTDLTFRYDGAFPVQLAIYDDGNENPDKVLFGPAIVNPTDEISITKRDGQDKFSSNISLWIDGVKFELHTSCSQPIGPGVNVGDFVIVTGTSRNGGDLCPLDVPTDPGCDECDGGVTQLAFKNVTGAPVAVEIYDDKDPKADKLLFAGTLMAGGETGTLSGTRSDGKFNSNVSIWVDGVRVANVHTSCSQPIGVGMVFGGFEVVSGASRNNGPFCPADCAPAQLNFEVKDDELKFKIANNGTTPLQIQKIVVEWPEDKGDLKKIEFDGTIFEQNVPWQAGPVEFSQFEGDPGDRSLEAGDDHELKLRFDDKTKDGLHYVRVEFNSGCVIEASSETPPGGGGTFTCSKDIDALTMIWQPEAGSPAAGQDVYVKAWKDTPGETLLFADDVALGGEFTVSGYAPKDGNDVVWEIFASSSSTTPLGTSVFHLSCSDSEMNGAEDCGKRQGDGKGNDSSRLNDWLFEGIVDSDETFDCNP